jgi:hypothetical protein
MPSPRHKHAPDTPHATPRRKPGRSLKTSSIASESQQLAVIGEEHEAPSAPLLHRPLPPPSLPFRSLKIALSVFKDQPGLPKRFDRNAWSNKLYSMNPRETLESCRFLGLIDDASAPTPAFKALIAALGTTSWPTELRRVLEASYQPLLACRISMLTDGGLLRTVRTIYGTQGENTRKCCNFFIHAAREAALDIGPFLLANSRSRRADDRRGNRRLTGTQVNSDVRSSADDADEGSVKALLQRLPAYDASWSEDLKRLWFGAFNELVQRLKNPS